MSKKMNSGLKVKVCKWFTSRSYYMDHGFVKDLYTVIFQSITEYLKDNPALLLISDDKFSFGAFKDSNGRINYTFNKDDITSIEGFGDADNDNGKFDSVYKKIGQKYGVLFVNPSVPDSLDHITIEGCSKVMQGFIKKHKLSMEDFIKMSTRIKGEKA